MTVDGIVGQELPVRTPLGAVADEALDRIASLVQAVLDVPVALVSLVDQDGQVFPGQAGLPQPWRDSRCTPLTHSFCQHVVRSAQPLIVTDARSVPMLMTNSAIDELGVVAYAGIPLVDRDGVVVGSLCAVDTQPRDWTASEVGLLTDLAAACSAELKLRDAAVEAAESKHRANVLLELSEALSDTLTTAEISAAVSKLAITRLGGSFGGVTVLDEAHEQLTYLDLGTLPADLQSRYRSYPLTRAMPSADVVRTGQPLYFANRAEIAARYPEAAAALRSTDGEAAAYLPLRVGDRVLGTTAILWSRERMFSENDRELLTGLSRYTAQAVARALLLADRREVAETLQAAMLPVLPTVQTAELTARYFPARVSDAVGGDWYDAFELPDGSLQISVGDVEGHDTAAAAIMGQLRATLRALAIATPEQPAATLSALDTVLTFQPFDRHATGILASFTRHGQGTTLHWSNAGHPPPLLLRPDRPPTYLDTAPQIPLGIPWQTTRSTHTMLLPPASTLLLFTDGLYERRDRNLDDSLRDLADSSNRHRALPLSQLVDAVLADMLTGARDDDIVVLAARTPPDPRAVTSKSLTAVLVPPGPPMRSAA